MSYKSRVYRQRNAHQNESEQSKEQGKFFTSVSEKSSEQGGKSAFFQAKSEEPAAGGDALEKEAEKTATTVADQDAEKNKKDETIQKLATPEEDKKTITNDERQKNDKEKQS